MDNPIVSSNRKLSKADIAIIEGARLGLYSVDAERGIVYNKEGKVLKGTVNHDGYIRVKITYPPGKVSTVFVHRLIAYAVWGERLFDLEVNHINEIKADNRIANLELVTRIENMQHSMSGEKNHVTKLTAEQVTEIRRRYKRRDTSGNSGRDLAREFGTTNKNISQIIRGKSWRHVMP